MAVFHSVIKLHYLPRASAVSTRELFYQINFFFPAQIFPDERFDGLKVGIKVPAPAPCLVFRCFHPTNYFYVLAWLRPFFFTYGKVT